MKKSLLVWFIQIVVMVIIKLTYSLLTFVMQGLTVKDMEELRDDIKMYLDLDRATPTRVQYREVFSTTESHLFHSR